MLVRLWRELHPNAPLQLQRTSNYFRNTPKDSGKSTSGQHAALLSQPQLLIIGEIGYLPIDRQGANLLFQLVSRSYERDSIIITSNQSLGAWGEVFGDEVFASAILDRLLHHSITVNIKGRSFLA